MVHDMALTPSYVVLVLAPLFFDLAAAMRGGSPLAWEPNEGTRIALIPRDGGAAQWLRTDAFWLWHTANVYDRPRSTAVPNRPSCSTLPAGVRPAAWPGPGFGRLARPAAVAPGHRPGRDRDPGRPSGRTGPHRRPAPHPPPRCHCRLVQDQPRPHRRRPRRAGLVRHRERHPASVGRRTAPRRRRAGLHPTPGR